MMLLRAAILVVVIVVAIRRLLKATQEVTPKVALLAEISQTPAILLKAPAEVGALVCEE